MQMIHSETRKRTKDRVAGFVHIECQVRQALQSADFYVTLLLRDYKAVPEAHMGMMLAEVWG